MKSSAIRLGLAWCLVALTAQTIQASVAITSPGGGNNVSADKALNSTNGAGFTALGNIVITEGAVTDFAVGNNQTLILTIPAGWRFDPGVGTATFAGSANVTAASVSVTTTNVTVTFSVSGVNKLDTLTISGLQVQALDGANLAAADYIRNLFTNPGTAVIPGIDQDFTTFGLLNEVAGAARALAIQTQPGGTSTAGALFSPQPAVQVVDQFGSLCNLNNSTVVTAARAAGSGTLLGTLTRTAVFGVATYTNLSMNVAGTITIQFSATNLTSVISAPIVVGPAPADHLVFATQPGSASAGFPFGIQPAIKTQDRFGSYSSVGLPASKLVTVSLSSGSGPLSGTTTLDIGTAAGNGTIAFTDLQIGSAGTNKQLTAASSGLTNAVSTPFGVSAAFFSKLQLLVPGEMAAPGTANGKTGTPSPQAAGTPFNVTVNAVDANWNLVNTIADTVGITSSSGTATLPPDASLTSGTKIFSVTLNTVGSATLIASDLTDGSKTSITSPAITVGGGTPRKLALQTPPSTTATAGVPFAQQPVIAVQDAGGNLVATDNGRVITVARATGTAALQGTVTATTVNGLATFTNLSYNLAETITLNFAGAGLTNVASGNLVVSTGPFSKLQLLVPGEIAAPGSASGKTGTPSAQIVGTSFGVTVNAVDAFWNLVNTVSDTVGLSSSGATATLPPATSLLAGTTNLTVSFNSNGSFTLTTTDLDDSSKGSSISPAITVSPAQYTAATGGGAISADGATGTFTTLNGPIYSEKTNGHVATGTIILKVPTGFVFDTGGTAPTIKITGNATASRNINAVATGTSVAMSSVTSTQLTFTVTSTSNGGVTNTLTWQNVRVRPTAGTPLASGILSRSGTATVVGLSTNANLGLLREVSGAASLFEILTQPSATATAGAPFAQQPVLQVRDQFSNLRNAANGVTNGTLVTAARLAGSGTLQGTLNATSTNGVASFTNLSHNVATNITLIFSASGVSSTNSSAIAISAAAADRLVFVTQPGSTTYGSALSPQPALKTRDPFGNDSTVGLGPSQVVTLTASTGSLLGVASLDIGTAAGNGIISFSGLQVSIAGTARQLSASSSGLASALSSSFNVNQAMVSGSITANNKIYDGTTASSIATRVLSGALAGDDVSLSGGTASFASKSVGTARTVTASGLSLSGAAAGNYQLASTTVSTTADITVRSLTVSATGVNKAYDGTTSATVSLSDNRVAGDGLTTTYTGASFADKSVGTGKPLAVSGISISGTDAANYTANASASATANITARSLNVTGTGVNKIYDGNTTASVTLSDNRVAGDSLTTSYTSASFSSKSVGTNKAVSVSGISVTGTDAANYTFNSTASTTGNITARSLSVTATGVNKVYDGNTSATVTLSDNRVAGDSLTTSYSSASFASKNIGTAKPVSVSGIALSGADAANYSANSTSSTSADITTRSLTVSAMGVNKAYDGTTNAAVTLSDNRVAGDSLATSYSSASFSDPYVGTNKIVAISGISVSGTDADNYSANTTASTTANISTRGVTVAGIVAADKIYDATTNAALNTAGAALLGVISGDTVTLNTAGATAAFSDKNAGTNKTVIVSALSLSGTDATNYTLSQPTTTASISRAGLTVTADNKSRAAGAANPTLTASYSGFVGGETLATSGVTGSPALSTTTTNLVGTYPITAALGSLSAVNYSFSFVNGQLTVTAASASRLVILSQPSATATAGVPFAQQPQIRVEDQFGNLRSSDNTTVITAARNAGSGTLQGSLSAAAVNGVVSFANLSHNVANTINLSFSSSGLTNASSANILVSPAAFAQLQLLVPGESAAPGSVSGKTGTPSAQIAGTGFGVTVNAVDAFWNLVNTVSDTVGLSSSDTTATLPTATDLLAGTTNLTVSLNSNGSFTLMATDLDDGSKGSSISPAITVGPAQYIAATGGTNISADGATGTFTSLTGPIYSEKASGNVGTGTIILKAPTGFIFDTGGTAPTVKITSSGTASRNINAVATGTSVAMSSVTSTQLTFTVTSTSNGGVTNTLTWQNVRVRPAAGTPLASGILSRSGTASVVGLSTNANLGTLREVAGAANRLAILTQPSATATAGMAFAQQPVLQVRDQFGNFRTNDSATVVTAARTSGTLQGATSRTALNGLVSFTNLSHNVATNITITFSASGVSSTNSSTIAISPAVADHLVFSSQPGSTTYGLALSSQPVLKTKDPFGNDSTVGLGASQLVTLSVSAGTGSLLGTTSLDIGTAAGNGAVSFSGLQVSMAGTSKQLSASASGLTSALSSSFDVGKATVTGTITANSKVYDGTTAATIASRSLNGVVGSDDVSLSGGIASFATKAVGTAKTVTATGLTLSGADAGNYQLASTAASTPADIATRSLTVSATGVNKGYDGTTTATVTLSDNRVAGDSLSTSYASASFADKNIGTSKTVSVSSILMSGADAANYSANTTASTTANITARALSISATGINKVYDGNTTASVTLSDNRVAGDSLATSYTNASFATKSIGTNKTVSVSGISVTGTDAANYTFNSSASTTANVTGRSLSVTASGSNKVYDGTTNATVTLADNRLAGDSFSTTYSSASFANKNVGTAKTVSVSGISISGADAANYSANSTTSTTADITVRSLDVTATGVNKVYDGTAAATVTLADNRLAGDSLTTSYASANFADKTVGTTKPVSVSGISIGGTDAANYSANTTASSTANITARALTISATGVNKVYDGTTNATATLSDNRVAGDSLATSYTSASFSSKSVGTNKTVSIIGLSISGTDAPNYTANTSATTTANITSASLTPLITANNKTYDGTAAATIATRALSGTLAGDNVSLSGGSATFATKSVGTARAVTATGLSLSGTDAANYQLASTSATTTADITTRSLTVSAMGVNKAYDGTTNAAVTLSDNRVAGDSLATSYSSASFSDPYVGTNKIVAISGISVSGTDADNYSANTTASTTANISTRGVTVAGIVAADKIYDATTNAALNTAGAALLGVISGDTVTLNTAGATAAFSDKNAGTNKTVIVSALSLSGTDATNYTLSQPTTTASISRAGLTVTADNKSRAAGAANPTLTASYSGFVGGETLATSGVTGSPALSTTTTNLVGTYPITAALGSLSAVNYSFSFVNGQLTVTAASASRLVILSQPSATATAGVPFAQQPQIRVEDQFGNLRSSDNTTVITAARNAGSGTLQGSLSAAAVNGVASFANLSHNVANTINLSFSSSGLTNASSANILVSPAAFAQLQLLVPGESAAPGSVSGKTGTPSAQIAGTGFGVTVNAVDAFWNLVNTVSDTVGLSSSDTTATLPTATDLLAGTTNLTVSLNSNGSFTLMATDLDDGSKGSSISPAITVSPAQYTQATGGTNISADTTGGNFTSLTGPSYSEKASGNVGTGTIILKAPAGFVFDTAGVAPTVRVTSTGAASKTINGATSGNSLAMSSVTTTQLTFTVTVASSGGALCTLTWQNVRVRPAAGTPLASGSLSRSGTASVVGLSTNANLGTLREVAGAANRLAILTQPSATATAGVAFAQQPVLQVRDQFGNFRTNDSATVVTAARNAGSGTLQGATSRTALYGIVTFTNLSHNVATNITISFTGGSLSNTTSSTIAVSPAAAARLVFVAQPGNGVVGSPLSAQPILRTQDLLGNDSTAGLGANRNVTLTLSAGTGPLLGTTTLDIGTGAGNGIIALTDLRIDAAGTNKQLTASASSLSNAVSSVFSVAKANQAITFSALANKTYGDPSFTLSATSSSGLPVTFSTVSGPAALAGNTLTLTGAGSITVRASQSGDANWNGAPSVSQSFAVAPKLLAGSITANSRIYDGTTAATIATRALSGVVGSDIVALTGGSATFADKNTGNGKIVAVTGLSLTGSSAGNYQLASTSVTTTADITAKNLAVSGVTANNKIYDGGTVATINAGSATTVGLVSGDIVTLNTGSATGAYGNGNVGTSKAITVSGIILSGADAGNYTLTQPALAANITPATITVTADNKSRTYGAANPAFTVTYNGFVGTDDTNVLVGAPALSTAANINSPANDSPYTITVTNGTLSATNYDFTFISGRLTITPAVVTVPARLTGIQLVPDGIKLTLSASANHTYQIERAAALQNGGMAWTNIGSATTDATGQGEFTDTEAPVAQGFYRTVSP